jgi:hypothetical protein
MAPITAHTKSHIFVGRSPPSPLPPAPNIPDIQPPMKAPMIPTIIFPIIPNCAPPPTIKLATHPAIPPKIIQSIIFIICTHSTTKGNEFSVKEKHRLKKTMFFFAHSSFLQRFPNSVCFYTKEHFLLFQKANLQN